MTAFLFPRDSVAFFAIVLLAYRKSADILSRMADNPGIWMYHCHVNDHMLEGMSARYEVRPRMDVTQGTNKPVAAQIPPLR